MGFPREAALSSFWAMTSPAATGGVLIQPEEKKKKKKLVGKPL